MKTGLCLQTLGFTPCFWGFRKDFPLGLLCRVCHWVCSAGFPTGFTMKDFPLGFRGSNRFRWTPRTNHGNKSDSFWYELIPREPGGANSVVIHNTKTPSLDPLRQSFGLGGRNLRCTLSVYFIATKYCYKDVCNFPDYEIFLFTESIQTSIQTFKVI